MSSSKSTHKRHADLDSEDTSRKRHKKDKTGKDKKDKKKKREHDVIDDDDDMWVEKTVDVIELPQASVTSIPTAKSLAITSNAAQGSTREREEWMLPPQLTTTGTEQSSSTSGDDFFSSLGTARKKAVKDKPDPEKLHISRREINPTLIAQMNPGQAPPDSVPSTPAAKPAAPGGPGSHWRMMKLRRVYETAEEEGRPVQEVALERYGSLEDFLEAEKERGILDKREAKRGGGRDSIGGGGRGGTGGSGEKGLMFTELGRPGSRNSFRKPGESAPSTPTVATSTLPGSSRPINPRVDSLRGPNAPRTPSAPSTPIPSVMTPQSGPQLSASELNQLQAKALRAKLMDAANAAQLQEEFEAAKRRSEGVRADGTKVALLPTLDGHGRLYDTGLGGKDDDAARLPGNRKKKEKVETRDPKTGDIVRYNADDDETTLGEMLRQERFGAGMSDQKDMDAEFARAIASDGKFQDDLEYMDDNAEKLGRKKMRTDAMKRQFAIHDYKKTQSVLSKCQYCYGEDDSLPKVPIIAMATRCYLACTPTEELVEGHCHIVPIQHHLCSLEGDDDLWDEVRNFMKCLIRMFDEQNKGVVFFETVMNLKWQKHTYIECVPVPYDEFADLPQYFKESLLASETEWSQHKKVIDFSARPGGFRRALVPNLPYFMVQFDYKGEKGYGHIIEGTSDASGAGEGDGAIDEGEKGGGEFPKYFAGEIIGNVLEVTPRLWRKPRRVDFGLNQSRTAKFKSRYDKYDWTALIGKS